MGNVFSADEVFIARGVRFASVNTGIIHVQRFNKQRIFALVCAPVH